MINEIKSSIVKKLLPVRDKHSHKGDNGKVLIVGGSIDFHGAPILAGLGALNAGADLVYLYVPECNFDVTRGLYPDFIVRKYSGDYLNANAAKEIIEFGKNCDAILIGPGISDREEAIDGTLEIIKNLHIPTVLDAQAIAALKKIEKFPLEQPIAITPHTREFQNLIDKEIIIDDQDTKTIILLRSIAMDLHINILIKGPIDYISSEEGEVEKNLTGNPGMTVGGSGDVLAGVCATLISQGLEPYDALRSAAYYLGIAGDELEKKKGYHFSASELAGMIGNVLSR